MDNNTPLHGATSQDPDFSAELCQFLTSLAKTSSEDDYSNLSLNMTRLREALLTEVVETEAETPSSPRRSSDTPARACPCPRPRPLPTRLAPGRGLTPTAPSAAPARRSSPTQTPPPPPRPAPPAAIRGTQAGPPSPWTCLAATTKVL